MGLLQRLFRPMQTPTIKSSAHSRKGKARKVRGRVERLEPRQLLAADGLVPDVLLGSVYFEEATGDDSQPDIIEVTFVGGARGTTLDRITISGDKRADGLTDGDIFFDTSDGGLGEFKAVGLSLVDTQGFTVDGVSVIDGGTQIVFTFSGFEAGESLKFSVDADELQFVDPAGNSVNSLVEGAEFERNTIRGEFSSVGFVDLSLAAVYWDAYDANLAAAETSTSLELILPADSYSTEHDFADRTAGAVAHAPQIPLATLSGWVYHDRSDDGVLNRGSEEGIGGVTLELLDAAGNGTGITTTTSTAAGSLGYYEFRNLTAGTYGVREVQPSGWLDGKDTPGSHGGIAADETGGRVDLITGVVLGFGDDGVEYNFGELLVGSIAGRVHATTGPDCNIDDPEILLSGVRVDLLDANGSVVATTETDSQGRYRFANLSPGEYQVREHQPSEYYDGDEHVGTAGGIASDLGESYSLISEIQLGSGVDATGYHFCEHVGPTLSGWVYHDRSNEGSFDRTAEEGIGGVVIELLDAAGNPTGMTAVTSATAGSVGYYEFTNLAPGKYGVREVQPDGWLDGIDSAGTHGGVAAAEPTGRVDRITGAMLAFGDVAREYNFGELLPATISGRVHASSDGDCDFNDPEILLAGVQIDLLDETGTVISVTSTDANGEYRFGGLAPGVYEVFEHQPNGYFNGGRHVGTAGGRLVGNDGITQIVLTSGLSAIRYDFCEHTPGSISGRVHATTGPDCDFDNPQILLAGVQIDLLSSSGAVIATTYTGTDGRYRFDGLDAGEYRLHEHQPPGYFDGEERIGTAGGKRIAPDDIANILLSHSQDAMNYDFCEHTPGSIAGRVHASNGPDCDFDDPVILLPGVQIDLLDASGSVIATTYTDASGQYRFDGLEAGEYRIREYQPSGYYDGEERVGTAGGELVAPDDIARIQLARGQHAVDYDFCEHVGVSLSGWVYHDRSNDGVFDRGPETGISGVTLKLLDDAGNDTGRRAVTNPQGFYEFTNLAAGKYAVMEVQPTGWLDGIDTPGNLGGTADPSPSGDMIQQIMIAFGQSGTEYNFGELLPGSIRGQVHVDTDGDCEPEEGDPPIAGVTIDLLDEQGNVIATTVTNSNGQYAFEDLRPGTYSVHEHQPVAYFNGGYHIGSGGGSFFGLDTIGDVHLESDQHLVDYDFCEVPPAKLSGYVFIDGPPIFSPGGLPDDISSIRDGQRTPDDRPLEGVVLELRQGYSGDPIFGMEALPGFYSEGPIRTVTDASGYYEFSGLPGGTYAVVEVQPNGLIDSLDTQGTTGGLVVNVPGASRDPVVIKTGGINVEQQAAIEQMRNQFGDDVIFRIPLAAGQHSQENNFSEVATSTIIIPPTRPETPPPYIPPTQLPTITPPLLPLVNKVRPPTTFVGSGVGLGYTWHLSLINAGFPRSTTMSEEPLTRLTSTHTNAAAWQPDDIHYATWQLGEHDSGESEESPPTLFGVPQAIPIVGDWDGDGDDDIGVFIDGKWYIDLNDNGRWDAGDLLAELGDHHDQPVTGDWDGDGKTDIAIFGPLWVGDGWAIEHEPGLPDVANSPGPLAGKPKNVPPTLDEATEGNRTLQRTYQGKPRADLIDHVFHYGGAGHQAVTGDWNGDGIATIGVFRGGTWNLDLDGDGRLTSNDAPISFGGEGIPVVGDWNGDGIDDLGVFADGVWTIDSNGNRDLDAVDRVFEMGSPGDRPVAGDWDGDGSDEPGIYSPASTTSPIDQAA